MLTLAKVTSGLASGYATYLEGKAQTAELGDYYLKDGERVEAPGRWAGGATALGANPERPVGGDELRALMAVRRPDTGLPLRRVGGNGQAVCAIDATFSAPKSVSAVWALASPELRVQVERAQEDAVDRALGYAVERVPMIRERLDKQTVIRSTPAEVIATSWRHTTARAVNGQPPDPQLHSHVLLHGAVRRDERIVAIESRAWFVHRRELAAAYRTELARELNRLGFQIERGTGRGGRYFELTGIPEGLVDRWSSRHHQVRDAIETRLREKETALQASIASGGPDATEAAERLDALRRSGRLLPNENRYLAASTRAAKGSLATHGDLDEHWWQTAQEFGIDSRGVERLRTSDEHALHAADDWELLDRLTEFDATFAEREARAVALEASAGVGIDDALYGLERLRADGEVLTLADGRATSRPHRTSERRTVSVAERLAAARVTALSPGQVEKQTHALDAELKAQGAGLAREQRLAVELACSDRQLVIIEGQAGTGKSTALIGIARVHQAEGRQIIVTSTGALAAERLAVELSAANVSATAYSTVALHAAIKSGWVTLGPRATVIHDEAALASTREQQQLLAAIEASGARLIEVGDPRQSQAVGAGGLWPHLEHAARENEAHVELTRIVRARHPEDRRDQQLFRQGQHERALKEYASRDRVILTADQRHAEDAALDAAHADRQAGKRTLVIAQTSNEQLDELNARAQAIRHQDHELGPHGLPVTGRPYQLHAGDEIQIRHPLDHPDLGRVQNGTTALILDIDTRGRVATIRLADGRESEFTEAQIDHASARLSYVQHPVPAQGHTTDTAHLIVAEHATQEGSYVALTRARDRTHIHASREQLTTDTGQEPIALLAERMGRSEPEIPSIHTPLAPDTRTARHDSDRDAREHPGAQQSDINGNEARVARDRDDDLERPRVRIGDTPGYLTQVLGERPDARDPEHDIWQQAALAIENYRARYNIAPDEPTALGPEPQPGRFEQRQDRTRTATETLDALEKLDRNVPEHGAIKQRILNTPGLVPDNQPALDQTLGWEP
jgi:conjugative relaxase-like TrwC/TraI family protein